MTHHTWFWKILRSRFLGVSGYPQKRAKQTNEGLRTTTGWQPTVLSFLLDGKCHVSISPSIHPFLGPSITRPRMNRINQSINPCLSLWETDDVTWDNTSSSRTKQSKKKYADRWFDATWPPKNIHRHLSIEIGYSIFIHHDTVRNYLAAAGMRLDYRIFFCALY